MKTHDLNYGSLRISTPVFLPQETEAFTAYSSLGWHECNRLYGISRPDGASEFLLIFTVGGEGELVTAERAYTLSPSTVAVIPPNVFNEYRTKGDKLWEFYWFHPTGEASERILRYLMMQMKQQNPLVADVPVRIYADIFESVLAIDDDVTQRLKLFEYISQIFYRLCRDIQKTHTTHRSISRNVMDYIALNYGKNIKISHIASDMYVSVQHMIKCFREETGTTPHEHLNHVRLSKARELILYTDMPVSSIADAVGFAQTSNFISKYREKYGITPGEERKRSVSF